ncbi:MAG: glycosyltransferase 87 family protein [Candidatus Eremiobacteraeota bacterium]|nr:glycosyltransferase 87 family protein [Candidatus Eremiobacteraeota bacterium]
MQSIIQGQPRPKIDDAGALAPLILAGSLVLIAVAAIAAIRDVPRHAELAIGAYTLLTVAAIVAGGLFWDRDDARALIVLCLVAFGARLLLLEKTPFLSTDAYRYLWEGRVLLHGIDPYLVAPNAPQLHFLRLDWLYHNVDADWRSMPSLYPPLALALFAVSATFSQADLTVTKILMELGDVITLVLVLQLLREHGLPRGRAVLYAWSPLVLIEFAWSAHLEAWCLAALAFALLMYKRHRIVSAALGLAAAVLIKLYPAAAIPLFFPRRPWQFSLSVVAAVACGYAPFVLWNANALGFLPQFAAHYHFNQSLHAVLAPPMVAALFGLTVCALVWARRMGLGLVEALIVLISAYFLVSPAVHPWYLTVFAVLLPLLRNPFEGALAPFFQGVQLWLLVGVLGYAAEAVPAARVVEYAPVFIGALGSVLHIAVTRTSLRGAWLKSA